MNVGILGVGSHLPETVRTNDWWPKATVERWESKTAQRAGSVEEHRTDGERRVIEAMQRQGGDPFKGAIERRVIADSDEPSDLETRAAEAALSAAGIDRSEIDLLLGSSYCPDILAMPNAIIVHRKLGLSPRCFTTSIEAACNSFLMQLELAQQMIASGRAHHALLVQSSVASRILRSDEPFSPWFGDGATAVVVGRVSDGRGVIAASHRSDSSYGRTLVCGVSGKRWHDEGRAALFVEDRKAAHKMLLAVADMGKETLDDCFAMSGTKPADVGYFASHQASIWFRTVCQDYIGMTNARAVDSFSWAGSLTGCNLPLVLDAGVKEGMLRSGDLVALYSGGTGVVYSGALVRWGR